MVVDNSTKIKALSCLPSSRVQSCAFECDLLSGQTDFGYMQYFVREKTKLMVGREFDLSRDVTVPHYFIWEGQLSSISCESHSVVLLSELSGISPSASSFVAIRQLLRKLKGRVRGGYLGIVARGGDPELRLQFAVTTSTLGLISNLLGARDQHANITVVQASGLGTVNVQICVKGSELIQDFYVEVGAATWSVKPPLDWNELVGKLVPAQVAQVFSDQLLTWWTNDPSSFRWAHFKFSTTDSPYLKLYKWFTPK